VPNEAAFLVNYPSGELTYDSGRNVIRVPLYGAFDDDTDDDADDDADDMFFVLLVRDTLVGG
jgi:hypothetical protein